MNRFTAYAAALLALGAWSAPARAQQNAPQNPPEHKQGDLPGPIDSVSDLQDTARMVFKLTDENNDNKVSQKEAVDAANLVVGGFFFRAAQNGDGVLSKEEARSAREAFLASKPWLRYVVETVRTAPEVKNAAGNANATNPRANMIAALASTFDTNNDKQIQAAELRQAVQTVVQGEFATADTNRDGQLTPEEINASVAGMSRQLADASFKKTDTDNNGQISQEEFEKAIVQPARVAFRVMDLNHDGQISQQEAQTARQVVISRIRAMSLPEPANSPRHRLNTALGSPAPPATPAPPAPAR